MKKYWNIYKKLFIISFPVLVILLALLMWSNGIFFYSEMKPSIVVTLKSSDSTELNSVFTKISNTNFVAKINKQTNTIEFQNINLTQVENEIDSLKIDWQNVTRTTTITSSESSRVMTTLLVAVVLLLISGTSLHFFSISAKGGSLKIIIYSYFFLAKHILLSTFIVLGGLSLISRLYEISILDITLVFIVSILSYFFYYFNSTEAYEFTSVEQFGKKYKDFVRSRYKPILFVMSLLVLITAIGLGINFVLPALILIAAVKVSLYSMYWMGYMSENFTNLKTDFAASVANVKMTVQKRFKKKDKTLQPLTTSKKKDHSKKKKKKK